MQTSSRTVARLYSTPFKLSVVSRGTLRKKNTVFASSEYHSKSVHNPMFPRAKAILDFWFGEGWENATIKDVAMKEYWFKPSVDIDNRIRDEFGSDLIDLLDGKLDAWQTNHGTVHDALAGIILGDQLCRNIHRGSGKMYDADPVVLPWTKAMVDSGRYKQLTLAQRFFINLPFMHSEQLEDQELCCRLCEEYHQDCLNTPGGETVAGMAAHQLQYAIRHKVTVEKYGRFPHRNALLGRENTPEEAKGLADGSIEGF